MKCGIRYCTDKCDKELVLGENTVRLCMVHLTVATQVLEELGVNVVTELPKPKFKNVHGVDG